MSKAGTSRTTERRTRRSTADQARNILNAEIEEGFVGRWVNDNDNRIQELLDLGYEFVPADKTSVGDKSVDNTDSNVGQYKTKNVGKGITAYLMQQRKDWYEEDKQTKADAIDQTESSLRNQKNDPLRYGNVDVKFNK